MTAGADPGTAATLASGAVKSLSAQPTFSTLGDLFAKYTGNVVNAAGINSATDGADCWRGAELRHARRFDALAN